MSVEQILRDAINRQNSTLDEADAEVKRIADKHFKIIGDPYAVAADLKDEEPQPEVTV